jgi:hypothetical protein
MKKVTLQIETADSTSERAADLTLWLKDEIRQLPIESVEVPKASALPEGARSGEVFSWATLTVSLAPILVEQLLNLLRDRIKRQKSPAKVAVECDGKKVTIEGDPNPKQLEAVERFLKEINPVSGSQSEG